MPQPIDHQFVFGAKHSEQVLGVGPRGPQYGQLVDLYRGTCPALFKLSLVVPGFHFYWLCER